MSMSGVDSNPVLPIRNAQRTILTLYLGGVAVAGRNVAQFHRTCAVELAAV